MDQPLTPIDGPLSSDATVSAPPDAEILDREALWHRVGGDSGLLREIIDLFIEEAPRLVAEVRAALARHDSPAALRSAHRLRGAAGDLAALRIVALAAQLESRGRQDQWEDAPVFCQALDNEIARLRPLLGALVRKEAA